MIKSTRIGIGSRIIQSQVPEEPAGSNQTSQIAPETKPVTQIKPANTSIIAESQMAGIALQAQLKNQLLQNEASAKLMDNTIQPNDVGLKSPLAANENQWLSNNELRRMKLPNKNEASNWTYLPKTLSTGDGDDKVDIKMGADGRVHVNVNGMEAWSGTPRQFQALTINTGAGKDVVKNEVDGANIITGSGNDQVYNKASNVTINTDTDRVWHREFSKIDNSTDDDLVESEGSHNEIKTGRGDDDVRFVGDDNSIMTGLGDDDVDFKGDLNRVNTGSGDDDVEVYGGNNRVQTESGKDKVEVNYGDYLPETPTPN